MKKSVWILAFVLIVIAFTPKMYHEKVKEEKKAEEFLIFSGWEVGDVCEKESFEIPDPLNDVYLRYNEIQKRSGFDLQSYCGKKVVRYTYEIKNHKKAEKVYGNVLMCDGVVIGGDIMTRGINGFMHEITGKEFVK